MRRILILLACLLAGGLAIVPARAEAPGWVGQATLISGTARMDAGEWIYTDFVYDDYGADTGSWGQPNVVSLAPTIGDARYPDGLAYADNAADIVEVRARPLGEDLEVRVLLQTLTDASAPALWVAAGSTELVVTAANGDVDIDSNTITFTIVGAGMGAAVALNIGAGLNDGSGGLRPGVPGTAGTKPAELTTGGPTENRLLDLAFNTRAIEGRGGAWNEDVQAKALAALDLDRFAQTIDLEQLRSDATTPLPLDKGYSVRLFESRQNLGEGVASSFPQFRGRWQPYALWIPQSYDPATPGPLFINMHSLSVHHNQYRGGSSPTYRTFYEQMGDALGAVVVTPLGRGPDGWYEDEGLVDTLEVWADARDSYRYDDDRVLVSGYSMGGYGTYRLTTLMPDAFASAVSVVGPPANGIWAYPLAPTGGANNPDVTRPQLENTLHIPFWVTHGVFDELVPVAGVKHQTDRFAELGHEHRFALHPAADHLSFTVQDNWSRESAWLAAHPTRVTNPHRVTFKVRPASWATNNRPGIVDHLRALTAEVGARLDGAYWLGDVTPAGSGDVTGFADLSSGGITTRRSGQSSVQTIGLNGPSPHLLTGLDVFYADADGPSTDTISGSLSNISSLTVDVGRAGLSNNPQLDITADRSVTITFVRDGAIVGSAVIG